MELNELNKKQEYFISFLGERFTCITEIWAQVLGKKFDKEFIPIYILQEQQYGYYKQDNHIIIRTGCSPDEIHIDSYEALNRHASKSNELSQLITSLKNIQQRAFITVFTTAFLDVDSTYFVILGSPPDLVTYLDSKNVQVEIFRKLDVPRLNSRIHDSINGVITTEKPPFFISAAYGTAGSANSRIYSHSELNEFYGNLSEINRNHPLVVSELIEDICYSVNINSIVLGVNNTANLFVSDQILNDREYLGNIYPSSVPDAISNKIKEVAIRVGNHISIMGFKGVFGIDFLVDSSAKIYAVDLNPRHQGGYMCNVLMLKDMYNLISCELNIHLGYDEEIDGNYNTIEPNVYLAWKKIKPNITSILTKSYNEGTEELAINNGQLFQCIFFSPGKVITKGHAGYMIVSGNSYLEVKRKIDYLSDKMAKDIFLECSVSD